MPGVFRHPWRHRPRRRWIPGKATTGPVVKVKIAGAWVAKPLKVKVAGSFVTKTPHIQ